MSRPSTFTMAKSRFASLCTRIFGESQYFKLLGLLILALSLSCNGSKGLAKKGEKLNSAGLYTDAALYYYNSLQRNKNNIDARIGLTKTGQQVLNDKYAEFSKAKLDNNRKAAVYAYRDAENYYQKLNLLDIKLSNADYLEKDYEQIKKLYIKELYDLGNEQMAEKKFDAANTYFKEIELLEPGYKDIGQLRSVSLNEPLYLEALDFFDQGLFRKAYTPFETIFQRDPNYKDVGILRAECLDRGKYPVTLVPFENATKNQNIEKKLNAFLLSELTERNDPFLKITERTDLPLILKEQKLNLSAIVDGATASKVGNLLGTKAIITGSILTYSPKPGTLKRKTQKGFESYQVKLRNPTTEKTYYETRYKPVEYTEYYQLNEVVVSVQYKAISLETGEVLFSDVVESKGESSAYYATYQGEIKNLVPMNTDGTAAGKRERNELLALLRADRSVKSVDELASEKFSKIGNQIGNELSAMLRDR